MYKDLGLNNQLHPKTAPTVVIAPSPTSTTSSSTTPTEVLNSNSFYTQENKSTNNNTAIILSIIVGAIVIAAGTMGGLFITTQIKEGEARIAKVEKEKEETELKIIEAERKILEADKLQQERAQKEIELERQRLEAERARAKREQERLVKVQQDLNNSTNNVTTINEIPSQLITTADASYLVNELYSYLSAKDFDSAIKLYSPSLQASFDPSLFNQFDRVSVENLEVTSSAEDSINLVGSNTYYYYDDTTQKERRSYQVALIHGEPKIVNSKFIKVTKMRK